MLSEWKANRPLKMNFAIQFLHERLLDKDTPTFQTTKIFTNFF